MMLKTLKTTRLGLKNQEIADENFVFQAFNTIFQFYLASPQAQSHHNSMCQLLWAHILPDPPC